VEFDFSKGKRDFCVLQNVMIGTGAHPASYTVYQEILSLTKRQLGHEVDSLPPPSTDLLCGVILLLPIVCLHVVDRDNIIFTFSIHNCALVEDNIAVCQGEIVWKIVH
jgi:hypothetical protein